MVGPWEQETEGTFLDYLPRVILFIATTTAAAAAAALRN